MANPIPPDDDQEEKLLKAIEKLTEGVAKNTDSKRLQRDATLGNTKIGGVSIKAIKGQTKSLINNTTGLLGLTASMLTLHGMLGDIKGMNARLSKDLGQLGTATKESFASTMTRFESATGKQSMGMSQALETFSDAIGLGMTGFSDALLRLGGHFKVLGLSNKTMMSTVRGMTQALGNSEESQIEFMNTLVSTAAANKTSADGMINAIESMKDALTKTTVELGPNATARAAEVAAMMGQGNEELKTMSAKFVGSFLAGTEGFEKAARLGVQFTGQESTGEMAAKFETLLQKIGELGGQAQGPGSQFFFDAMEKQLGLNREDFMLQQRLGNNIQALVHGNVEAQARQVATISVEQAYQNATFGFQQGTLNMSTQIASVMDEWNKFIPMLAGIGTIVGVLTNLPLKIAGFMGKALLSPFRFIGGALKDMGRLIGNVFKGRGFDRRMAGGGRFKAGGKMVGNQAGKAAAKMGTRIPLAGALIAGGLEYAETGDKSRAAASAGGALAGGMAGAKLGFMIGSFLGPLGSAAGTLIGGAVGAISGEILAKKAHDVVDTDFTTEQAAKAANKANQMKGSGDESFKDSSTKLSQNMNETLEEFQKRSQSEAEEAAKQRQSQIDLTKESLDLTKSKMQPASNPFTAISGALVNNLVAINNLVGLTEMANEQRLTTNETLNNGGAVTQKIGVQATG